MDEGNAVECGCRVLHPCHRKEEQVPRTLFCDSLASLSSSMPDRTLAPHHKTGMHQAHAFTQRSMRTCRQHWTQ